MRVGRKMAMAIEFVKRNPGCSKIAAARYVTPCSMPWLNWAFGYGPINRAIAAGLIRAEKVGGRYVLTVE